MPNHEIWIMWFVLSPVIGLLIGSFLNVCIYRLPKRETVVKGHSYCPACGHTLQAIDLVPIFSYLFLRGRCRYCQAVISPRYMLIELWACLYTLIAIRAFSPYQPWSGLLMPTHAAQTFRPVWQALLLGYSMAFAFYIFLVWAMILKDRKRPPVYLYGWLVLPIIIRFIFQPDIMIGHIIMTLSVVLLIGIIWLIITYRSSHARGKHNPKNGKHESVWPEALLKHQISGVLLMLLYGGYPVLVLIVIALLVNGLYQYMSQKKDLQKDSRFADSQAALLLFLASISWIFF